jgi:hypothetical protein
MLVVVLFLLFLLTLISATLAIYAQSEKQIVANQLRSWQTSYEAEAGISEALARMSNSGLPSYMGEDLSNPSPGWGRYIVAQNGASGSDPDYTLCETDNLDNDGDVSIDESGECYPEVVTVQPNGQALSYNWVRVSYKLNGANQVVLFGDHDDDPSTRPQENLVNGMPVLRIASSAQIGNAQRTITVEAVCLPSFPVPASVYAEGDFKFNGTQFHISGYDYIPGDPPSIDSTGTPVPAIVTTLDPTEITDDIDPNQEDNFDGAGDIPSIYGASNDLDLHQYVEELKTMADISYGSSVNNPNTSEWGSETDPRVVYIKGDIHL